MEVAINTHVRGKPKTKEEHAKLTYKCENLDVTADELSKLVKTGYTFCAQHRKNHRRAENFIQAGFIAVDIDKDKTIEDVLSEDFTKDYCSFIYTTENHSADFHRFRIVFELESPITNAATMKNAFTGIIQKYGGDVSCKDATRLFYGSKQCDIHWVGKTLPDNKLEEIVLLGEERHDVKSSQDSVSEGGIATVQSRTVIDPDKQVMVKDGMYQRLVDIPPQTKVHCPVHIPDKKASAITFRSSKNVPGIYCATCGKSYFTSTDLPLFDFNYGLTNLDNLNPEEILIEENDVYWTYEELAVKRFSEPYLPYVETTTPVVFVKSPKGTGKTEWLLKIVKECRKNKQSVLLIGHRRSLITSVAKRLNLKSYLNHSYMDKNMRLPGTEEYVQPTGYYAICVDSLSTLLKPEKHKYQVVLIDEVEQVFAHLTSSTVKDKRNESYLYFKHYVDTAEKVFVTDADVNYLAVETIADFVSDQKREVTFLVNDYKPEARSMELYGSCEHLLKRLIDSISQGERVFVCSNSKTKIKEWTGFLESRFGASIKMLGITSDNSQKSDIQFFMQNIKKEILNYDVVLVSPSVGTGVDITFPENKQEIDCVYGFFEARINTHFDIDQQLSRVRHPKKVRVWISPEQFRFETNPKVIRSEVTSTDRSARKLLNIEGDGTRIYDEPNNGYLNLYANVKSLQRGSKNHLRKHFIKMKEFYGWSIEYIELDKDSSKEGSEISKISKELREQARINNILSAPLVDMEEYIHLKSINDKLPLVDFQKHAMRRYEIESFYYTEATKELLEKDSDGKLRNNVREYQNYVAHDSSLIVLDTREMEKDKRHITDRRTLLKRKQFLKKTFELAGLSDDEHLLITDKKIHKDQLKDCIEYIKKNNTTIQRWFDTDLRKDIDKKPVQQLGVFLKRLGIKWKRTVKKGENGGKDYYYQIPQETLEFLDSIVEKRSDEKHKEQWYMDRTTSTANRLFEPQSNIRYQIKRQIKTGKINPVMESNSWEES